MKKLLLHIGSHKTGSTSIQSALFNDQPYLNSNDIFYFNKCLDGSIHHQVSSWIKFRKEGVEGDCGARVRMAKELATKLNDNRFSNVILSIEGFSWILDKEEIERLHKELSVHFDTKIIVYIRRQDKLAISHHQQGSKRNNLPSCFYYKGDNKALPSADRNFDYLNYDKKLSKWSEVFGAENMIIRIFESNLLVNNDVVDDFFHLLGLQDHSKSIAYRNTSNGFEFTKVGHLVNLSNLNRDLSKLIRKGSDRAGKSLPSRQNAEAFYNRYRTSNIELNRKFNISSVFPDIFDNDFSCYPEQRADLWTEESANQAIQNILASIASLRGLNTKLLRDSAIALEAVDMTLSHKLMSLAKVLSPKGRLINKKLSYYDEMLGIANSPEE